MMNEDIKTAVSERYAEIAKSGRSSLDEKTRSVAKAFGYSEAELASIPAEANMGVSCGNPTAMAGLREERRVRITLTTPRAHRILARVPLLPALHPRHGESPRRSASCRERSAPDRR